MKEDWREVSLGEFIQLRKDYIILEDDEQYRRVTVRLYSKGIELRDVILGAAVKTKRQYPIKAGDLVVAEIDAKVGGYGIAPADMEGAIVSSHYYLYEVVSIRKPAFLYERLCLQAIHREHATLLS